MGFYVDAAVLVVLWWEAMRPFCQAGAAVHRMVHLMPASTEGRLICKSQEMLWKGRIRFNHILPYLYDKEVIHELAIVRWAEEKGNADESNKVFIKQSDAFIHVYVLY